MRGYHVIFTPHKSGHLQCKVRLPVTHMQEHTKIGQGGQTRSGRRLDLAQFLDMRHIGMHREAGVEKGSHVTPVICKMGYFSADACCIQCAHCQRHEDASALIRDRQGAGGLDITDLGRKPAQRRAMQTFTRVRIVKFGCQDDIHCPPCYLSLPFLIQLITPAFWQHKGRWLPRLIHLGFRCLAQYQYEPACRNDGGYCGVGRCPLHPSQ